MQLQAEFMTAFKKEIIERVELLKEENLFNGKKKEYSKIYTGSASEENGDKIKKLDEFQVAFIDLFHEKNSELGTQFHNVLENYLKEMVDENGLNKINLDEDIGFYNLIIPQQQGTDEWSIELASSFDETIFHAYFDGWQFQNLGLTH